MATTGSDGPTADELIERLVFWSESRDDVRGLILVGSRARVDPPADEWSDVDVAIMTNDPGHYLESGDWLDALGPVDITFVEGTAFGGYFERRLVFVGGLDVDVIVVTPEVLDAGLALPELSELRTRGFRVLLDKDGAIGAGMAGLPPLEPPAPVLPSAAEFEQSTSDFWYHTIWAAKKLRRGELWVATTSCNHGLALRLLEAMEWQARATDGRDTWHRGRFVERWADPATLARLPDVFALLG